MLKYPPSKCQELYEKLKIIQEDGATMAEQLELIHNYLEDAFKEGYEAAGGEV